MRSEERQPAATVVVGKAAGKVPTRLATSMWGLVKHMSSDGKPKCMVSLCLAYQQADGSSGPGHWPHCNSHEYLLERITIFDLRTEGGLWDLPGPHLMGRSKS